MRKLSVIGALLSLALTVPAFAEDAAPAPMPEKAAEPAAAKPAKKHKKHKKEEAKKEEPKKEEVAH